jgi:D-serine dehydratase
VVAKEFAQESKSGAIEVVLRPGCYLTHDVGIYQKAQSAILARNPVAKKMGEALLPALQLWAYVQSIPEPDRAIVGFGKRDAAFDAGLPVPARHYRPGTRAPREIAADEGWEVTGMMDQHAYLRIAPGADLKVGDMLAFDISHPCLTFDKWRQVLIVDSNYQVTEVVETFF